MPEIILSINAGSSSVKVSVYKTPEKHSLGPAQLAEAIVDGLTAPPSKLKYERSNKRIKGKELEDIKSQEDGFRYILDHLINNKGLPELTRKENIQFTCHRVVHGGDYPKSQVIDKETYYHIKELSDLVPLHNAPALSIIRAISEVLSYAKNIAYFNSAFYNTMPDYIYTYLINQEVAKKNKLRKYRFYGISYSFIVHAVSTYLKKSTNQLNIIALHLGSGVSACCIKGGKSLNILMGLTPLAGLLGATRSGSINLSLIFYFTHSTGKLSKGLSERMEEDKLAFNIFVDRTLNYIAPYFIKLDSEVDALVFGGGIGERSDKLRKAVVQGVKCLGFAINDMKNGAPLENVVTDISTNNAKYKTLVVQTDEQLEMARAVLADKDRFVEKK